MKTHRIAAIPGDGIGVPVSNAALAVAAASGARLEVTQFDWSAAMMLDHLGEAAAAARIMAALEATTARGIGDTPGKDKTDAITRAVLTAL